MSQTSEKRKMVMVVSHERSGTHFLMNALHECLGYAPQKDRFDLSAGNVALDYNKPGELRALIKKTNKIQQDLQFMTHHAAHFFAPIIKDIEKEIAILYIYRNPVNVIRSFWRMLGVYNQNFVAGPKCESASELLYSEPRGSLLQYQIYQYPNMFKRWQAHIEGWMQLSGKVSNIYLLRYEDLSQHFAATIEKLGKILNVTPTSILPPKLESSDVIVPPSQGVIAENLKPEDLKYIKNECQPLLVKLGYQIK